MSKTILIYAPTKEMVVNFLRENYCVNVKEGSTGCGYYQFTATNDDRSLRFICTNKFLIDRLRGHTIDHIICVGDLPHIDPDIEKQIWCSFDRTAYIPLTQEQRIKRLEEQVIKLGGTL